MPDPINLPDLLGFISGGVRADYGVLHAASAVSPNPAKAGKPIDVAVLLQNTTESPLEVIITLGVPQRDAQGKTGSFVAKVQRLAVGMQPCEVGVLTLPLLTQPVTAPGTYTLTLQVSAKATGKATRVRLPDGGGALYAAGLPPKTQKALTVLRELTYVGGSKRGLFGGSQQLEPKFTLEAGTLGGVLDRKADYMTLWLKKDLREDPKLLIDKHKQAVAEYVLPSLDRTRLLEPLSNRAMMRFKDAGYDLTPTEASMIARVMTQVVEYACTGQLANGRAYPPRSEYEVYPRLGLPSNTPPRQTGTLPMLPPDPVRLRWFEEYLTLIDEDERAARFSSRYIPERCFEPLLRDALILAIHHVEMRTGNDFGSDEELERFADDWMEKFLSDEKLNFADVYLPLVLAGILIHREVAPEDENLKPLYVLFTRMLHLRDSERTEENQALFDMTEAVIDKIVSESGISLE